jgi:hypothetical protein
VIYSINANPNGWPQKQKQKKLTRVDVKDTTKKCLYFKCGNIGPMANDYLNKAKRRANVTRLDPAMFLPISDQNLTLKRVEH